MWFQAEQTFVVDIVHKMDIKYTKKKLCESPSPNSFILTDFSIVLRT